MVCNAASSLTSDDSESTVEVPWSVLINVVCDVGVRSSVTVDDGFGMSVIVSVFADCSERGCTLLLLLSTKLVSEDDVEKSVRKPVL